MMKSDGTGHRIHTVFLDAGGTLVQSPDFFGFMAVRLSEPGRECPRDFLYHEFMRRFGDREAPFRTIKELLTQTFKAASFQFGLADRSGEAPALYRQLFVEAAQLYPGVREVLAGLSDRGVRLIMISDADADILYEELDRFNIRSFFEAFVISGEVEAYKPDESMVAAAVAHCREPFHGILLVGDSAVDYETARKMGVTPVAVHNPAGLEQGAAFSLDSLTDLLDFPGIR